MANFAGAFSRWFMPGRTDPGPRSRSRLRLSFSADEPGCVLPGTRMLIPISAAEAVPAVVTYYRIRVEATSLRAINGCAGCLTGIFKDGTPVMSGETVRLPFAPADAADALAKRIHPDVPAYLDFLMISTNNQVLPCAYQEMGHNATPWVELFKEPGEYRLRVVVTAGQMTSSIDVLVIRSGDGQVEIRNAA
jgi:hypothetical protein